MTDRPLIIKAINEYIPLGVIGKPSLVWDVIRIDYIVMNQI